MLRQVQSGAEIGNIRNASCMTGARDGFLTYARTLDESVKQFIERSVHVGRTVCIRRGQFQSLEVRTVQTHPFGRRGRANTIRAVVVEVRVAGGLTAQGVLLAVSMGRPSSTVPDVPGRRAWANGANCQVVSPL